MKPGVGGGLNTVLYMEDLRCKPLPFNKPFLIEKIPLSYSFHRKFYPFHIPTEWLSLNFLLDKPLKYLDEIISCQMFPFEIFWKSFLIPNWQFSQPFFRQVLQSLPFYIPPAWKRYPFWAEPPRIAITAWRGCPPVWWKRKRGKLYPLFCHHKNVPPPLLSIAFENGTPLPTRALNTSLPPPPPPPHDGRKKITVSRIWEEIIRHLSARIYYYCHLYFTCTTSFPYNCNSRQYFEKAVKQGGGLSILYFFMRVIFYERDSIRGHSRDVNESFQCLVSFNNIRWKSLSVTKQK